MNPELPSTTNTTATNANTGIKITGGAIVAVVESMILADFPALGLPILKHLWEGLFTWVAGYFIKAAEHGATFMIIDHQVSGEQSALSSALKNLIAAQTQGNPDAIKKAIQDYANAHSALVHSDGSSFVK